MQPYRFVMRPVGNNQINPYFNPPIGNPANPLVSYQVNLQVRQCAVMGMNPPYNPQMMHPLNACPFPSGNPGMINPQYMGPNPVPPMNQRMVPMQNPSVNTQHFPNMNGLPVPPMNCPPVPPIPPVMPHRPPNMPPVNLSQPIPNLNSQMLPPMNCQSFQSVNCQNIRPPMPHIPPGPARPMPPPMSQPIQAGNPPNYPQNVPNVNYPNMPILNPQNGTPVRGQMNAPMVNSQNFPPSQNPQSLPSSVNPENCPSSGPSQNFPPSQNTQNCPPTLNPYNFPPSQNPMNFVPSQNPQNFHPLHPPQNVPSTVNQQKKQKAKPKNKLPDKKPKEKKPNETNKKAKGKANKNEKILWVDPTYKKLKKGSEQDTKSNNKSNTLTNGVNKPKQGKQENPKKEVKKEGKKEEKKVVASKPNKEAPSNNSNIKNPPLITIKSKGDNPLDEKKTQYFKNLRSLKTSPNKENGKKKLSENDKIKARVLKIFSLMQKLKGVCKKLWQNVAANGEFKDNPGIREEVTKFFILSHKFLVEVDCIAKITKKEEPPPNDKAPKKSNTEAEDSKEASNNNTDQTPATASKQAKRRKGKSIPFTLKLILKKLGELDALGLCFVNINGIFIKRYCSMIIKLRKSLNALLEKSKTSCRKKRLKIPKQPSLPQSGAILLTCSGKTSYEEALQMALKNIKFKVLGIQCVKQRRTVTGGVILEVFANKNYDAKTDKLAEKLKQIYASVEVRVTRPQKYGDLVIKRLDPSATVEQIREQLAKLANCSADVFKTGSRGKTCMWVRCPLTIAFQLDQKTIEMESTVARINLRAKKLIRCYKCFNMGHVKNLCTSDFDHNNLCFKCGQKDHEARTCQNAPRCLACYDNSLPTCHRLGGEKCPSAIPKIIKWPTSNVGVKKDGKLKGKGSKGKKMNKEGKIQKKPISRLPSAPDRVRGRN